MDPVQPLRISKPNTPSASPSKMTSPIPVATSKPLAEIGSTERRRNSPSYNQATKKMLVSHETSPYMENSSPPSQHNKGTPRNFWQEREVMSPSQFDSENSPEHSPSIGSSSPRRRPSIERLAQASRVKNSNIFALENKDVYDPTTVPIVERPSANRLGQSVSNNAFTRFDSLRKENNPYRAMRQGHGGHRRNESDSGTPNLTPAKSPLPSSLERSGSQSPSPTKSSIARTSMFDNFPSHAAFDPESGAWSDDGEERAPTPRTLRRHAKSVTFHEEPPVVNEYEQQTPEPSLSVASDREGSWDSDDFEDQDISFERGSSADQDRESDNDSFDEDLENADKTPVVLPEDWTRMSPDEARTDLVDADDDVFDDGESSVRNTPSHPTTTRVASDGESRPLPPLPAFRQKIVREGSDSLASAAERAAYGRRMSPSAPKRASCSKEEILSMGLHSNMSLEDRLKLINGGRERSQERPSSKSSQSTTTSQGKPAEEEKEEELTITNLDTGEKMDLRVNAAEVNDEDLSEFTNAPTPRISRESILRKVRNSKYDFEDDDDEDDEDQRFESARPSHERPPISELAKMHPDEPIPSRENSRETSSSYSNDPVASVLREYGRVEVKEEPVDDESFDLGSVPAADEYDRQNSVLRHAVPGESESGDEEASKTPEAIPSIEHDQQEAPSANDGKETLQDAMALLTVKDYSSGKSTATKEAPTSSPKKGGFLGLPTYDATDDDYDFGMTKYITPSPPISREVTQTKLDEQKIPHFAPPVASNDTSLEESTSTSSSTSTPREREVSPPESVASMGSVIHHMDDFEPISPVDDDDEAGNESSAFDSQLQSHPEPEPELIHNPVVPEREASIKTNGKLKARKSETQADLLAMAEQRRLVSADYPVPPIPREFSDELLNPGGASEEVDDGEDQGQAQEQQLEVPARKNSRKGAGSMDLSLDTSAFSIGGEQDGLGLDHEFDRLIEAQKKGYLMRQNTKVVVATTRNFSGDSNDSNSTAKSGGTEVASAKTSADGTQSPSKTSKSSTSSPRKASGEQFLKTEPWNGKTRRKSIRHNSNSPQKPHRSEPAPPLPGKESALDTVNEDFAAGSLEQEVPEGVERGRLFVKVASVKNLDLPMPKNDRVYFQLTLDNGLHCVTTADMELGRSAPIGQEFELVVLNDLEFQLTLSTKLPPPPTTAATGAALRAPRIASSPTKPKPQKQSGISKLLSSPKKRAEKERQEREAQEAEERRLQEEAAAQAAAAAKSQRASAVPTAWDQLRELVNAQDGSFARAYVNLKAHEKACFGRQLVVDVPCYNEWALEQDSLVVNSVRSKRGHHASGPIRRPPYVVGQLQLQLMYIPKPNGAADAELPKSMSSAIREIGRASEVKEVLHEGHLSQQGGDCTHWRRRFFRLQGPKLTAYHEHTHQKRAVINLTKASRLVDDRSTLLAAPSPVKSGKSSRRKSAFAEEDEEGYQYVEEGFRIRFANGETIDFYADSRALKDQWMAALSQVIGKPDPGVRPTRWTDLVLAREKGAVGATAAAPAAVEPLGSALRVHGTEVKDFSSSTAAAAAETAAEPKTTTTSATTPSIPPRAEARRKALPTTSSSTTTTAGSKSMPTSPVKSSSTARPLSTTAVPSPTKSASSPTKSSLSSPKKTDASKGSVGSSSSTTRSGTPPLQARKGHRTRDAVKSMIF